MDKKPSSEMLRQAQHDGANGLLLINKPVGITSFDVIRRLRRQLSVQRPGLSGSRPGLVRIGHAGTLDPMASGLMLMLVGAATKQAQRFSKLDKTYVAEITLGAASTTGDREGEVTPVAPRNSQFAQPAIGDVRVALEGFVGEIEQTPSVYSAIKINGQEAYKRARRGEAVEMPTRKVTVYSIKLLTYEYPLLKIEAEVSSGTYIRSLAEDIGKGLGTRAYLSNLIRTQVGEYTLENATELGSATKSDIISI